MEKDPNESELSEETKQQTEKLASALHEDWRKTRQQEDGLFEPRIKATKDEAWIEAHGSDQVDIANTQYGDLPKDWQQENHDAAGVVVELIDNIDESNKSRDNLAALVEDTESDTYSAIGEEIHSAWLKRNEWAKGGELDVPFESLPQVEKDKDIAQYLLGVNALYPEDPSVKAAKSVIGVEQIGTQPESTNTQVDSNPWDESSIGPKPGRFYEHNVDPSEHTNEWVFDSGAALDFIGDSPEKFNELTEDEQKKLLHTLRDQVRQSRRETTFRRFQDQSMLSPDVDAAWERHSQNKANLAKFKSLRRHSR